MKKYKKNKRYYYLKRQKRLGMLLLVLSAISAIILDGDITVCFITVPLGLYTIFTKEKVIWDYDDYTNNQ